MIKNVMALDWRAIKYYQIRSLLLPFTAFLFGVLYSSIMVIPIMTFLGASFSVNPFAVEEKGELNNLYLTLPITRNQIVIGRYALSFAIFIVGVIMGIPIMALSNTISFSKYYIGAEGVFIIVAISFLLYSIFNLFMFPILFKLGYQKGKMLGFYIPAILFSVIAAAYYATTLLHGKETITIDFIAFLTDNLILASGAFIILATAVLIISCMFSIKLYSKRSF